MGVSKGSLHCAFLTMDDAAAPDSAFPAFGRLGWRCEWLNWRAQAVDWNRWDAVYPAAAYDYPDAAEQFIEVLQAVEDSSAILVNPMRLLRWNMHKTYLRELQGQGVEIVPSRWYEKFVDCDLKADAEFFATDKVVVKPVISTNAMDTFLVDIPASDESLTSLARAFAAREFIVQPFVASVQEQGEYSLFYFGGQYSHAIRKVPKANDYRVQEEHGGHILPHPPDGPLRAAADHVLGALPVVPVYARCDYVSTTAGAYQLMELELIEPSLYLESSEGAASNFVAAFVDYVHSEKGA